MRELEEIKIKTYDNVNFKVIYGFYTDGDFSLSEPEEFGCIGQDIEVDEEKNWKHTTFSGVSVHSCCKENYLGSYQLLDGQFVGHVFFGE